MSGKTNKNDTETRSFLEYRKNSFEAKLIDPLGNSLYPPNIEKLLTVTHNGHQWSSITLTKSEARFVIQLLREWVI